MPLLEFVDLCRRFRDLTEADFKQPDQYAFISDGDLIRADGWPELLKEPRLVILAEAGAGKTREMREQVKRLVAEGKFAFFLRLEDLAQEQLPELLSAEDECRFWAWQADGQSLAWFFLDAVDELKLTGGRLDRALARLARAIKSHLERARIVISCRPSDWRPILDLTTVEEHLPVGALQQIAVPAADELFLAAIQREEPSAKSKEKDGSAEPHKVRMVALLPLGTPQIRRFAQSLGVKDAATFLAEIDRQDAWTFARRPLDLSDLIATWTTAGRLGTRVEQHEANVRTRLKDDPTRPDRGALADTRAREGAERLALALTLTRTRTVRSPEQALDPRRAEAVLDMAQVLSDWSEEERQALLRRALFDPATYGRVRFHHSSVQDYLAACRLKELHRRGMATTALHRLLFAQRYGVNVVVPSMQAIAGWLALWNEDVRQELMKREPEVLLSLGDPGALPLSARAELVRAFAGAYSRGGWRGLTIPISQLRRLAHPELGGMIRELWGTGPSNSDVRELLLGMVWQGPIKDCEDIAYSAALDGTLPDHERVFAIRALLACGTEWKARAVADAMLCPTDVWPIRIVCGTAADLFPRVLAAPELIALVERTDGPKRQIERFAWSLDQIAGNLNPESSNAVEFRDALADLIWRGRDAQQHRYAIHSRFDALAPALALLCGRQLEQQSKRYAHSLISACVIAARFGADTSGAGEPIRRLKAYFAEGSPMRAEAFWAELSAMDALLPSEEDQIRLFNVEDGSLLGRLEQLDRPWLKAALVDVLVPKRQAVALHALIDLWWQRGGDRRELNALRQAVSGNVALLAILTKRVAPPQRNTQWEQRERDRQRWEYNQAKREEERLHGWRQWRDEVRADPATAFSSTKQGVTIENLYSWLHAHQRTNSHYDIWNSAALANAFGDDVARRAEAALRAFWRIQQRPVLWSDRSPGDRNKVLYSWIYGLCGVSLEARSLGWAARLTPNEAQTAAAYATVEINGLSPWIADLAIAHPNAVDAVLGGELDAELDAGGDHDHLRLLADLGDADIPVQCVLAPRLLARIENWPADLNEAAAARWSNHLEAVLQVLDLVIGEGDRASVAALCERRFIHGPTDPQALAWLRGLFRFAPERGAQVLESGLAAVDDQDRATLAVRALARLFSDDTMTRVPEIADPSSRAIELGRLLRCAYQYVRLEDDRVHDGPYTPDLRDRAERARMYLLTALVNTPGPDTYATLLRLAEDPMARGIADHLRFNARLRAALDAEFTAYTPREVFELEQRYEAPPHDRDGLFAVLMDRLDDLAYELAHGDFNIRKILRKVSEEDEMQNYLAGCIQDRSNGAYTVVREPEVADRKRLDFQLAAMRSIQRAAVEVKIADKWDVSDLVD